MEEIVREYRDTLAMFMETAVSEEDKERRKNIKNRLEEMKKQIPGRLSKSILDERYKNAIRRIKNR